MHYVGHGICHKVTYHIPQTRAGHTPEAEGDVQEDLTADDMENLETEPRLDEFEADEDNHDGIADKDMEDVDTDEEVDFGYGGSEKSKEEQSKDENDEEAEDDCAYYDL